MSAAWATAAPPGIGAAPGEGDGELARLLMRRSLQGLLIGLVIGLSYYASVLPLLLDADAQTFDSLKSLVFRPALETMFLALLLTLVLRYTRSPAARFLAIVASIAFAAVAGRTIHAATWAGYFEEGGFDMLRTAVTSFWISTAVGTVMAVFYVAWERMQRSVRALHDAQLAQQRAEHGVLEARLNVMRARVEPEFLFEALGAARGLYARDPAAAERMLEDLISYLRASLPRGREHGSTLSEEVHLAASYLEVCSALAGRRFRLDAQLAPGFADIFFPPRVLLPLVEDAVARARGEAPAIRVRAGLDAGRARVEIEDDGTASAQPPAALRDVSKTLKAFYGPDARADTRSDGAGSVVTLEFLAVPPAPKREMP